MFPVRIVIKLIIFNVHVFEHVYCLTYIVFAEIMLDVPVASLFNTIGNCLRMEIVLKLYATVFQLVCKILYDKENIF